MDLLGFNTVYIGNTWLIFMIEMYGNLGLKPNFYFYNIPYTLRLIYDYND